MEEQDFILKYVLFIVQEGCLCVWFGYFEIIANDLARRCVTGITLILRGLNFILTQLYIVILCNHYFVGSLY